MLYGIQLNLRETSYQYGCNNFNIIEHLNNI